MTPKALSGHPIDHNEAEFRKVDIDVIRTLFDPRTDDSSVGSVARGIQEREP